MGRTRYSRLRERNGHWHINGVRIKGQPPLYESIGKCSREEAEAYYLKRITEIRHGVMFGARPKRTFREAASHYLELESAKPEPKATLSNDALFLEQLEPFIGKLELERVHDGTLAPFVRACRTAGNKSKTVNLKLAVARRVLNLAATKWRDEATGLTWMAQAPKIEMLPLTDQRLPYPLSWDEQRLLFAELPDRLARMALFAVNTGCRDGEICGLRWEWEQRVEELGTSVFVIPRPKNRIARVVVLNRIARAVVDEVRGQHPEFVFVYSPISKKGKKPEYKRVETMHNSAWQAARQRAADKYEERFGRKSPEGFRTLHVHDLRHTVGRRLRALRVPFETRQDVLGHKNGNITTHYSAAEVSELLDAVTLLENAATDSRPLTMLRVVA